MTKFPKQLWEPQIKACRKIEDYIKEYNGSKTSAACLIKMPTGSGKTGVITCVSHLVKSLKSVLIVAPRVALRTQIYDEVSSAFFSKISYVAKNPKVSIKLLSGVDFDISYLDKIVVTTIQKLNSTYKKSPALFNNVCKKFDLVIFDEGHYEPAVNWSAAIREIDAPKIIFTATPFRNDLKRFEFDSKYVYSITHLEAQKLKILRTPVFINTTNEANPKKFISNTLLEFNKIKAQNNDARLIIRCDDYSSILKISKELETSKEKFVAIHERIVPSKKKPWGYKKVPPRTIDADIWVHQFKLLEGFDDPRFQILATFTPFKNSRQLIQQIGRILRNPLLKNKQTATILDDATGKHKAMWESYLKYDSQFNSIVGKTYGDTLKEALDSLPEIEYIEKSFRNNYLKKGIKKIEEDICVPLSTNLYQSDIKIRSKDIISKIEEYHKASDNSYTHLKIDKISGVFLYITFSNSSFLVKDFFFDVSFNVIIYKIYNDIISLYDSRGTSLTSIFNDHVLKPIESKRLKKLVSSKSGSRLVNVNLKNSILGNNSITGHAYSAISINETTPYLDDHGQVISSIIGYSEEPSINIFENKKLFRRYLGFSKGKVTQSNSRFLIKDYLIWLDDVVDKLKSKSYANSIFKRYAKETIPSTSFEPKNILLDFSEIENIKFKDGSGEIDEYEVISDINKIEGKYFFKISLNDKIYKVEIVYDSIKQLFTLISDEVSETIWNDNKDDLIKILNVKQSFRIITSRKNLFYAYGTFFNPQLKIGAQFDLDTFQLNNIIVPVKKLDKIINEKGKKCQVGGNGWDKKSIFNLVDTHFKGTPIESEFKNTDILICDDMGVEVADFILCTDKKVVFIHVKGKGSPPISKVSASKLMDVCGQAVKNIEYLSMFNSKKPTGVKSKWKKPWEANGVKGNVQNRIRTGDKVYPEKNWEVISKKISDPSFNKEVWLVLGGILSKNEFIAQLSKNTGNSVALQTIMLLNGTLTNVSSLGGKLKILCGE